MGELNIEQAPLTVLTSRITGDRLLNVKQIGVGGLKRIDSLGLRSDLNFTIGQFSDQPVSPITTSSTSYVDVTGTSSSTFVLQRKTIFQIFLTVWAENSNWDSALDVAEFQILDSVDGSILSVFTGGTIFSGSTEAPELVTLGGFVELTAGTHTMKMQMRSNTAGTSTLYYWLYGYVQLGA